MVIMSAVRGISVASICLAGVLALSFADRPELSRPFRDWTLAQSVRLLTWSPWARQQTYTRVVGGIGSGVKGEKEIYTTFFVRFLSARPIREAFARVQQIQQRYDELDERERGLIDSELEKGLELDVRQWVVVTVAFRSNDHDSEQRIRRFLQTQTVETLRSRAYLATERQGQIELAAYFPPQDALGAKFVFPRSLKDEPIVTVQDEWVYFILDVPGVRASAVSVNFPVRQMIIKGQLII